MIGHRKEIFNQSFLVAVFMLRWPIFFNSTLFNLPWITPNYNREG